MQSSGVNAIATSDDSPVLALACEGEKNCTIINEGAAPGFFSDDGGVTWGRLPASSSVTFRVQLGNASIQVKRVSGGSNLSGIYAWAV